jgi:LmbE family N-acetylglucosaminyl deacetylase
MSSSILFVGAHCGDAEISAGAAPARAVRLGGSASVLHLTPGEKGHPALRPEEYRKIRIAEAEAAAEALGLSHMRVLAHRDAELLPTEELVDEVADFIRLAKPSVLITHWSTSIHPDHEVAQAVTLRAAFVAGIPWIETDKPAHYAWRVLFAENWEDRFSFVPHTYLDVTEDWEMWRRAAECYSLFRGEVVEFPYVSYYDSLSRVRGPESGSERAIAFAIPAQANRVNAMEL